MTGFRLTKREQQVLELLADGLSARGIGDRLGTTEQTVKSQLRTLYMRLGANNMHHAVSLGYRAGLLKVEVQP